MRDTPAQAMLKGSMNLRSTASSRVGVNQPLKIHASRVLSTRGMTLVEIMGVTVVVSILVMIALPMAARGKRHTTDIKCRNNLKNVGLAYRIWCTDGGDSFPFQVSTNEGGTFELTNDIAAQFRVLSNELSTPKILLCPRDYNREATNWPSLSAKNISFFAGYDAHETFPQSLLAGDAGFSVNGAKPKSGLHWLKRTNLYVYPQNLHTKKNTANICLGDGSVTTIGSADLLRLVAKSEAGTNRIILP
jgi:hypothetical protein